MQQNVYPCDKLSSRRHAVTSHTYSARVFYYNHEMSEEETLGPTSTEYRVDETSKSDVLSRKATLRRSISRCDYAGLSTSWPTSRCYSVIQVDKLRNTRIRLKSDQNYIRVLHDYISRAQQTRQPAPW